MDNALPKEMRRNGRPLDPHFQPTESLFIRLRGQSRTEASPNDIRLPIQSANRSKYSKPEWILLPSYEDCSVGAIKVRHVPVGMTSPGNVRFDLKVKHVPEDDNYAHSEIQTYKNGVRLKSNERKKMNQPLRLELKKKVAEKIIIVLPRL